MQSENAAGPWLDLGRLPAHGHAHLAELVLAEGAGLRRVGLAEEVQRGEDLRTVRLNLSGPDSFEPLGSFSQNICSGARY